MHCRCCFSANGGRRPPEIFDFCSWAVFVPGKVTFDGIAVSDMQPLQLYARTADRIEAATRLAIGRNLDIQA